MTGIITALEPQKHSEDRMNVYLDGEFAFGLAAIHAITLRVGTELSTEDIAALQAADAVEQAREKALNYLSHRPRSEAELAGYLRERKVPAPVIDEVLERLRRVDLVNDEAFAHYWIQNRAQFRPRGKQALVQELRQKGIATAVISAAMADYDEVVAAAQVAQELGRRLAHLPSDVFKRRLSQRMARRGFSYALIQEVLANYPFPDSTYEESEEL